MICWGFFLEKCSLITATSVHTYFHDVLRRVIQFVCTHCRSYETTYFNKKPNSTGEDVVLWPVLDKPLTTVVDVHSMLECLQSHCKVANFKKEFL